MVLPAFSVSLREEPGLPPVLSLYYQFEDEMGNKGGNRAKNASKASAFTFGNERLDEIFNRTRGSNSLRGSSQGSANNDDRVTGGGRTSQNRTSM